LSKSPSSFPGSRAPADVSQQSRPSLTPSFRNLARHWWTVLAWLGVIRLESTDTASASNTSKILYAVIAAVYPHPQRSLVEQLDAILRKSGHFLGYGILGVLVFFALRNTNRDRFRPLLRRPWGNYFSDFWRMEWAVIAVLFTIATASFDEIHQTFIPSRTGRWQDVVLDGLGAAVLQFAIYLLSVTAFRRTRERIPQYQGSSTL
jgi:VanZ family protein